MKKVESKSAVGEGVQRRQRKVKAFVQLDGPHGDSSSEDEEEEESDDVREDILYCILCKERDFFDG